MGGTMSYFASAYRRCISEKNNRLTQDPLPPPPHHSQKADVGDDQIEFCQSRKRLLFHQNAIIDLHVVDPIDFIRRDPYLKRRVLTEMVLLQEKEKRELIKQDDPAPPIITERFLWSNYPELLGVLRDPVNTRNFFAHSLRSNRRSKKAFSAAMVQTIRKAAFLHGYQVDKHMSDSRIRDKIFDYYMELWQDARRRVADMERTGRVRLLSDVIRKIEINCDSLLSKRKTKRGKVLACLAQNAKNRANNQLPKVYLPEIQNGGTNVDFIEHAIRGSTNETEYWLPVAQCLLESFPKTFALTTTSKLQRCETLIALVMKRLTMGTTRSCIYACHQYLREAYHEARHCQIMLADNVSGSNVCYALVERRDEIACLWCVYAYVLWSIGSLMHDASSDSRIRNNGKHWCKKALQTLVQAIHCPLVGNKACLTLVLARLMLRERCDDHNDHSTLQCTLGQCLELCKDAIDRAHCRTNNSIRFSGTALYHEDPAWSGYPPNFCAIKRNQFTDDVTSKARLHDSFLSVARLPELFMTGRAQSPSPRINYLYIDRGSVSLIAKEMNLLSKLRESLNSPEDRLDDLPLHSFCCFQESTIELQINPRIH